MLGSGRASRARMSVTASGPGDRGAEIYEQYAAALYRQALLTLDDAGLAEQVVCDILVDECIRPPSAAGGGSASSARCRLAVSAYRRCQELAAAPGWREHSPAQRPPARPPGCAGLDRLSREERGALGLVLCGGVSYIQASRELAISPQEMAGMLRAVLLGLTAARAGLADHLSDTTEP
jgi:hypothetical protein